MVLETAGLNATELGGYFRERGLYPEQVHRWRKAAQDANARPLLTMCERRIWRGATRRISGNSNGCSRSSGGRPMAWRRQQR